MFAKNLRCWFWPNRLNIMPGELQKKRRKFWEKKKSVHTKKKPKFLRPTSIFLCTKLRSCFLKMTTHKDKSRSATLCLTGALKKGIFPPPHSWKRIWEEKICQIFCIFGPSSHCFFEKLFHLYTLWLKKLTGQFFSSLYFFILLFLHHTLLLTSMKEKTTPPLIKTTTLAPLFNLANNYASIDQ